MTYGFLANCVLAVHLLFILFVIFGGFIALRKKWIVWMHLPAAAWGAMVELFGWPCPLTPLEKWLRALNGQAAYQGGFIERCLSRIIYPEGLTRTVQILLGLAVLVLNGWVYFVYVLKRRRQIQQQKESKLYRTRE